MGILQYRLHGGQVTRIVIEDAGSCQEGGAPSGTSCVSESSAKPSMSRDYRIRLRDMLAAAIRARAYATGIPDAVTLAANQQVLDAVMFNLFVLGEAAKGIPADVRARYAAVEW
jgi:hypothetical protein